MYGQTRSKFQRMPLRKSKMWVHITIQSQGRFLTVIRTGRKREKHFYAFLHNRSRRSGGNWRREFTTGYQRFHNDSTCHVSDQIISFAAGSPILAEFVEVSTGTMPANHQIVYHLQESNLADTDLMQSFTTTTNDQMLLVYLSSLLCVVIALHALVDNKATIGRAELEENWRSKKRRREEGRTIDYTYERLKTVCLGHGFKMSRSRYFW